MLRLQESCFLKHRSHMKNGFNALRKMFDQEVKRRRAALDAQATTKGKLYKRLKGVASLLGEAFGEAIHARGLQLERSRMFQSLEGRASRDLSDISDEGVSGLLVTDDGGYVDFFLRVVERLQAGAKKAHTLQEEKSRALLGQGVSDVFNHLLRLDPYFDFAAVLGPMPGTIRVTLAVWVEVHVEDLVIRLAPEGNDASFGDDVSF
ncbi:hypothetical protein D1007_34716 [Hordeum vulgare]|nr:hypothetical protein D1007_34716 [Hordeum vulgare]